MLKQKILGILVLLCFLFMLLSCGEAEGSTYEPTWPPIGENPTEPEEPIPSEENPGEPETSTPTGENPGEPETTTPIGENSTEPEEPELNEDNHGEPEKPTPDEENPTEPEEPSPGAEKPPSTPPAFIGIRLPMAPGLTNQEPLSYTPDDKYASLPITTGIGRYMYNIPTSAWIELYFETAPGTAIDPSSILELFRVEATLNALTFTPESVRGEDFTLADPREGWEQYQRLEIRGQFTTKANSSLVKFRILPGLSDKHENRSKVEFVITLLK